jgi:hypothetical protein
MALHKNFCQVLIDINTQCPISIRGKKSEYCTFHELVSNEIKLNYPPTLIMTIALAKANEPRYQYNKIIQDNIEKINKELNITDPMFLC